MSDLKEYCSLHLYIKRTNPALFQVIENTCTEHLFKFRYVTFLMPSASLLSKLKKEKPVVAAKSIKSLMLKGVFKNASELKGDVSNIANGKITNLSELKVKPDSKFIQWEDYDNLSVLLYDNADVPKATETERKPKMMSSKTVIVDKKSNDKSSSDKKKITKSKK